MRDRFKPLEWQKLVRLPSAIFHAVAEADGQVDYKEQNRFLDYVKQSATVDPLLRQVFDEVFEQGNDALVPSNLERDQAAYLAEMRSLLQERLSADERRSFLAGLLGLGHNIASASGGFFGIGNKTSAQETNRLAELTEALGLQELL